MATPFVRVDLSPKSRDFEFLVLDAGVPLLDPRGAHYQMLRKWLKGQVAEPEVRGQQAAFYVRSDAGARLEKVKPVPVTEADLDGPLRKELETLIAAIQKAEAKSRDEEAVLRVARDELLSLTTQQKKRLRCSYFFKYQDQGKPKLVWCAGYRRKDQDPSAPLICYNPNCQHLYVRKPNVNDCPVCKAPPVPQPGQAGTGTDRRPGGGFRKVLAFALLLLIAAGAVGVWYQFFRNGQRPVPVPSSKDLVITPETWSGPVGSRVEFTVKQPGEKGEVDVTKQVGVTSSNPNVLYTDGISTAAQARSPGTATLTFTVGGLKHEITVKVTPPVPPKAITLEPATVMLGIGTTARLKLMGEYGDGRKVDLTDSAEWVPSTDGLVFSYRGLLEGLEEGEGTVRARYRASSDAEPMEATAKVTVAASKYTDLTLSLDPLSIAVGQVAEVTAAVKPESGDPLTVSESSLLKLTVEPEGAATIQGRRIYATKPGSLKITGSFQGLEDAVTLEVMGEPETPSELDVQPKTLEISVGEVATLAITVPQGGSPLRVVSAVPESVEVLSDNRLVGRAEGKAKVEVIQGDKIVAVDVTVAKAEPTSVAFVPANLSVRVDDTAAVRVVATLATGHTFDIAPDALDWTSFPRPDYATLDKATLKVKGLKGTGEDHETLAVRFAGKDARADLQVVSAPARLELEPAGPVTIPVGQQQPFKVFASYGDGQRQEVSADRIEWKFDAPSGLVLRDGTIHAEADGHGPLPLSAVYGESTSNVVQVSSGPAVPLTLQLAAKPNTLGVRQSGEVEVTGNSPGGAVAVSTAGFAFESSDPNVLVVDPATGAFRGQQPGTARVIAKPPMGDPAEVEVTVTELTPEPPQGPQIASVRIVPAGDKPVVASVGVEVAGFKVEAVDQAGKATDRTADALLSVITEPDADVSPIMARDGRLIAVLPGEARITASVDGVPAEKPLPVTVTGELKVDEIRVTPKSVVLAVGETVDFEAEGFLQGQSVGLISDHPKVEWKGRADDGTLEATSRHIIALSPGKGGVTAQLDSVVSQPAEVTIVLSKDDITTPLVVAPETLRMEVGETRNIGSDVQVSRGGTGLSSTAEVSPANTGIVRFDPDLRRLVAIAPGRTRVTYSAGGQLASQDVEVVPSTAPPKDARLELSPNGGRIGVGERVSLQAMQVCDSCNQRRTVRTGLLGLTSSDPSICAVDGTTLVGMKPGQVEVTGKLPGIDTPATATFTVVDDPYQRIVIQPGKLDLALGQQRTFQVFGITDTGRRELADHPNLQITLEGDGNTFAELSASARTVRGLSPGKATLVAKWKDLQDKVEIEVNGEPVSALRIDPADGSGTVGQMQSFQTFARRGTEWLPVSQSEGVSLQSSDPSIARIAPDGRVEALQAGTALLTANYGGQRAEARVTVTQTSQPAPRGRPLGLRFVDLTFRMTLGSPGDNLRVVRYYADGFEEDVGHLVTLTARDPKDVVTITASGQGPVVAPARLGQTQLDAELDDLRSVLPLLVEVIEALPQQARLLVTPNPVQLRVGESRPIQRVEVVPPRGGNPVEVPYRLTASDSPILDVDDATKTITGRRDGVAMARVTVVDPNSKYDGMDATVVVEVGTPGPGSQAGSPAAPRLSLTGPSSTTVNAEVQLRAELIVGSQSTDVTGEAILSVSTDDAPKVSLQPGCRLVARQPGTVRIEARHGDQVSNVHQLRIDAPATSFERLELSLGQKPTVTVGERRPYELWGHPRGGGARQDLTGQIGDNSGADGRPKLNISTVAPEGATDLLTHQAPAISGAKPGRVRVQASLGALQSNAVDLSIVDEPPNQPIAVRIEPRQLKLREGDQSPDFRVLVRHRGESTFREIDNAVLSSGDSAVLAAVPDAPRKFAAAKPGQTTVKATFGGLSDSAMVSVITDRFRTITPTLEINARGRRTFSLTLDIRSTPSPEKLQYRVTNPETGVTSNWVPAGRKGEDVSAVLTAAEIPLGPADKNYRLILEAKDEASPTAEKYPYSFKITSGVIRTEGEK